MKDKIDMYVIGHKISGEFRYRYVDLPERDDLMQCYKNSEDTEDFDGIINHCYAMEGTNSYCINYRHIVHYSTLIKLIKKNTKLDHLFVGNDGKSEICDVLDARKLVGKSSKLNDIFSLFKIDGENLKEVKPKINILVDLD